MSIALAAPQMLEISGTDAAAFAQAQFSNELSSLVPGQWQWNAWLSPQGRVRYFFALLCAGNDRLRLLLRGGSAAAMREELARFVLRAKVQLSEIGNLQALGCDEAEARTALGTLVDANAIAYARDITGLRWPGMPARWLLLLSAAETATVSNVPDEGMAWRLADIRAGLPELGPALQDCLLPQWLGLDAWSAVSVRKGCYPGQEIIARLHFKGGNKRGLYHLELHGGILPEPGASVFAGESAVNAGVIVMAAQASAERSQALASLADSARESVLFLDGEHGSKAGQRIKVVSRFG